VTDKERPPAEEMARALAAAVNAARLYPPSSDLPGQALDRLLEAGQRATAGGANVRLIVDPHAFRIGDTPIAETHSQSVTVAESLHALQVGQLIIAPGMTRDEAAALVALISADPAWVRQEGGPRAVLTARGAARVAVVEVSLRVSTEEGLPGIDLTNAPLDEVARESLGAARRWAEAAARGDATVDEAAQAVSALEHATRELAVKRMTQALMRLDDTERTELLLAALHPGSGGAPMTGMLDVIARMNPSALARLLKLASGSMGATPELLASRIDLPPEVMRELMALLAPSPRTDAECGVPSVIEPERIAREACVTGDEDHVQRLIAEASATRAGRGLSATVAVLRSRREIEGVRAVGVALPPAARAGSLTTVREALRLLDEVAHDPALADAAALARSGLDDAELLATVCAAVDDDADAAIAGELLSAAGTTGAGVLLVHFARADERSRSLLRPVLRRMEEPVLSVAARRLRSDDSPTAIGILSALTLLNSPQVVTVVSSALEHLDVAVRRTAVSALASNLAPDARRALARSLGHWDPETRRWAIREVGRTHAVEALPALIRILEDINIFERNHELKKEVIKCLESLGSTDALPILKRWSRRRFILGRKSKELRFLATHAVERLSATTQEMGSITDE